MIPGLCLIVCLFVRRITQKVTDEFGGNFLGRLDLPQLRGD